MRIIFLVLLVTLVAQAAEENCNEATQEEDCNSTEYSSYVECLRRRSKRSLGCSNSCDDGGCEESSCDECNCKKCYGCSYTDTCNNCCSSCCDQTTNACTTNHCCHKICHASCQTSLCRSSCRRTCFDSVNEATKVIQIRRTDSSPSGNATKQITVNGHNVTTIIHLKNVINNTNIIDTPIKINTTNYNNFSVPVSCGSNSSVGGGCSSQYGQYISREKQIIYQPNCCTILSPRQCVPQDKFPFIKCFHYRYKMCGHMCYSQTIHQFRPPCQNQPCSQQTIQIPQPRPSCAYSPVWPWVSCVPPRQGQVNCAGCYDHHFGEKRATQCSPFCYDDGFGNGPYYRQGPFYQPAYSPVPTCQQLGTCGFGGYGYYGNGFMPNYNYGFYPPMNYGGFAPPVGVPVPAMSAYPPPPYPFIVPQVQYQPVDQGFNNTENVTLTGPVEVDEPVWYNGIVRPYDPYNYPLFNNTANITRDPVIHADIRPNLNGRHAEITIEKTDEDRYKG